MSKKTDKIHKLNGVLSQLKSEFIGLDDIIDEIGRSISPWFITPELNTRPVVVTLWGMTGTGKTSVVNRLLELLDLPQKPLYFDCGTLAGEGNEKCLAEKISEYFKMDNGDVDYVNDNPAKDSVFVFDEFQHARSVDESGMEVKNQALQPVWSLIDSGKLTMVFSSWRFDDLVSLVEDLKYFISLSPSNYSIKLTNGAINDQASIRDCLSVVRINNRYYENEENNKRLDPLQVVDRRSLSLLDRNCKKQHVNEDVRTKVNSFSELGELVDWLDEIKGKIIQPISIDCSKSLIFVLGNLDEAFSACGEISPDIDADVYFEETSRVTLGDIKQALKARFRAEQIARFGNSIIKYPTLKKDYFKQIISKELDRVCSEFKKNFNIEVKVTDQFKALIYSEGVFPTQGVRPVFSTISNMFNPILSSLLIHFDGVESDDNKATIDVVGNNFKVPKVNILIKYSDSTTEHLEVKLVLGSDRNPKTRKTRYINGIHEAGHAIVMSYCTGKTPLSIVAVDTDHGGFCVTFDPDKLGEIDSNLDMLNSVKILMGGWCAESLVFDKEKCLLGSSSDISEAWDILSSAEYLKGSSGFMRYSSKYSSDWKGVPFGLDDSNVKNNIISDKMDKLMTVTRQILKSNYLLLLKTGEVLGERGEISQGEFEELISKYGETLTKDTMEKARKDVSPDYYESTIEEEIRNIERSRKNNLVNFDFPPLISK